MKVIWRYFFKNFSSITSLDIIEILSFIHNRSSGAVYIHRSLGDVYHPEYVFKTVKFEGRGVIFWGCILSSGQEILFICECKMNFNIYYTNMLHQVYQMCLTKIFNYNIPDCEIFRQDNAPCYTPRIWKDWFEEKWIRMMKWPPHSPEHSSIEQLCSHLFAHKYPSKPKFMNSGRKLT